nr:uncharacterized protein LOC104108268 [Nicotiana tomentosiformis]
MTTAGKVRSLHKRKIDIACLQETQWVGDKTLDIDEFKLWYSSRVRSKNKVGILVDRDICVYAPQVDLDEEVKRRFWKNLDEFVRGIPHTQKLLIEENFNGHIGAASGGYDDVHGGFDF